MYFIWMSLQLHRKKHVITSSDNEKSSNRICHVSFTHAWFEPHFEYQIRHIVADVIVRITDQETVLV